MVDANTSSCRPVSAMKSLPNSSRAASLTKRSVHFELTPQTFCAPSTQDEQSVPTTQSLGSRATLPPVNSHWTARFSTQAGTPPKLYYFGTESRANWRREIESNAPPPSHQSVVEGFVADIATLTPSCIEDEFTKQVLTLATEKYNKTLDVENCPASIRLGDDGVLRTTAKNFYVTVKEDDCVKNRDE